MRAKCEKCYLRYSSYCIGCEYVSLGLDLIKGACGIFGKTLKKSLTNEKQ